MEVRHMHAIRLALVLVPLLVAGPASAGDLELTDFSVTGTRAVLRQADLVLTGTVGEAECPGVGKNGDGICAADQRRLPPDRL